MSTDERFRIQPSAAERYLAFTSLHPNLQHLVSHYFLSAHASQIAAALRGQIARLKNANTALRELYNAAAEWCGSWVSFQALRRRHASLLTAHQLTWETAFFAALRCKKDDKIGKILRRLWEIQYLQILIDRVEEKSEIIRFHDLSLVRIFGIPRDTVCGEQIMITDRISTCWYSLSSSDSGRIPLEFAARFAYGALECNKTKSVLQRLFSYGPIGDNDADVSISQMVDISFAIGSIIEYMTHFAKSIEDKRIFQTDYLYNCLDKFHIPTPLFHEALDLMHRVTLHSLEVARSRNRRRKAQ